MSAYPPPNENLPIFDSSNFISATDANQIATLSQSFLRFPVSQGSETISGSLITTGQITAGANLVVSGTSGVNYIQFPDGTQQFTAGGGGGGGTLSSVLISGNTATNSIILNNTGTGTNVISLLPNATTTNPTIVLTDGTTTNTIDKNGYTTRNTSSTATHYLNFSDSSATGTGAIQKTAGISCQPSTNSVTASTFTGALIGNVTGNVSGTAGSAGQMTVIQTSSSGTYYPTFVASTGTGTKPFYLNPSLQYDPSTVNLTATTFTGALAGNASTATRANTVDIGVYNGSGTLFCPVFALGGGSGINLYVDSGTAPTLTYNPVAGNLTTTTFTGALSGTATNATNAVVGTDNVSTLVYPTFVKTSGAGNKGLFIDDTTTALTYDPSTGNLTASTFTGGLIGNAETATSTPNATTASIANTVDITAYTAGSANLFPTFVSGSGTGVTLYSDNSTAPTLTYNPFSGNLTTTTFTGAFSGNATTATTATNIAGGLGGSIPYQTAVNATALLANGTAGQVLTSQGTTLAPYWTTPSSGFSVSAINTTNTYYPVFVTSTGAVTPYIDTANPFTVNPVTGAMVLNSCNVNLSSSQMAIGANAGLTSQGTNALAIGTSAGRNYQASQAVAIGYQAGIGSSSTIFQGADSVAIGTNAGASTNTSTSALGQYLNCVAIGNGAGQYAQGYPYTNAFASITTTGGSVAIGYQAGQGTTGTVQQAGGAVSIGHQAGQQNSGCGVNIGYQAGLSGAGTSINIGYQSGTNASNACINIGERAGTTTTSTSCINIGYQAGKSGQGSNSVSIAYLAGESSQGTNCVAIGGEAGRTNQGTGGGYSFALGSSAGNTNQGTNCVAIGRNAGTQYQGAGSVAIGNNAGAGSSSTIYQGANAVAIGNGAGAGTTTAGTGQGTGAVAIGYQAQQTGISTTYNAVAIGYQAGNDRQNYRAVAIGDSAGNSLQGLQAVALGYFAGNSGQGNEALAIGYGSGQSTQGANATAIGSLAGYTNQGGNTLALGGASGQYYQKQYAIAIGYLAGQGASSSNYQGTNAIAIGQSSGQYFQGANSIAIGQNAGTGTTTAGTGQGTNCIAIGQNAGNASQGNNAIAIGYNAGVSSQFAGSICLNASGSAVNPTTAGFYVKPVRTSAPSSTTNFVYYDTSTAELISSPAVNTVFQTVNATNLDWTSAPVPMPSYVLFSCSGTTIVSITLPPISSAWVYEGLTIRFRRTNTFASATTTSVLALYPATGTDIIYPTGSMVPLSSGGGANVLSSGVFYGMVTCINKTSGSFAWAIML